MSVIKSDAATLVAVRDLKHGDYFRHGGRTFRVVRVADSGQLGSSVVARATHGTVNGQAYEIALIPDTGVVPVRGADVLAAEARSLRSPSGTTDVVVDNRRRGPDTAVSGDGLARWLAGQAREQR